MIIADDDDDGDDDGDDDDGDDGDGDGGKDGQEMMKMTMTMMNNGVWHKISTQWINPLPSCVLFLR